jgi:hypothetical protein
MPGKGTVRKAPAVRERPAAYGPPGGEVAIYRSPDGAIHLDVKLDKDTVWLSQRQMAVLFGKNSDTIGLHIRNAFREGELDERATTEESSVVQKEGKRSVRRIIRSYNLDVIISVGYRVKSKRGTHFRIWATQESNSAEKDTIVRLVAHLLSEPLGETAS